MPGHSLLHKVENRLPTHLWVPWEWGRELPPQGGDRMEDPVGCYIVGLLDSERLLGLVFILIGVSLMGQTRGYVPCARPVLQLLPMATHLPQLFHPPLPFLWGSLSYQAVEGDGDLLASKCPPPACI